MLINLISSEPISFLIAFVSVCAFSLYSIIRGQANATKIAQLSQIKEQLQNDLNSERIAIAKLQAQNDAHQARIQALHAAQLSLFHPETEEWMTWQAPLPEDMVNLLDVVREDTKEHGFDDY